MGFWRELGEGVLEALFPENLYCMACNDFLEGSGTEGSQQWGLCDRCVSQMFSEDQLRGTLGKDCEGRSYSRVLACGVYGGLSKEVIGKFKNKNMPWLGKNIGALMAQRLLEEWRGDDSLTMGEFPDLVTFVPMYEGKKQIRGYDQAQLLAEQVGRSLDIPCVSCLARTRSTAAMKNMSEEQRNHNVAGAFQLVKEEFQLKGKQMILVDDILTTGSTAEACAGVLKQAGAEDVTVLTFAVAAHKIV